MERHPNHNINKISTLDPTTFATLARQNNGPCVTIYLATHNEGVEINEQADKKALKAALQQVEQNMTQQRFDAAITQDIIAPARQLLDDDNFWHRQSPGLGLFLSPGYSALCQLPFTPEPTTHINTSFLLSPLAAMLSDAEDYAYVLALSKHAARIYRADRFTLLRMDIPDMPNGMDDVIHFEEKGGDGVFRAAGGGADDKTNIAIYMKEIDRTLRQALLGRETAPLILAGVEYLLPIYRSVSSYDHIAEETLTGNFDRMDTSTFYQHIREKLDQHFDKTSQQAMADRLDHSSRVSSFPQEVIRAAFEGRIDELYVMKGTEVWGRYQAANEPAIHEQEETGDENLADQAVIQTVLHGGKAHVVENMPMSGKMAAVLRY